MIPKFEIYLRIGERERENIYYMVIWQTTPSGRLRWAGMQSALNELQIRGKVLIALHSLQAAVRVREGKREHEHAIAKVATATSGRWKNRSHGS